MLLSFRFTNHRSFREEQELLLLPAYDRSTSAVPVAAIYGANASGKSNLLDALRAMRTAVLNSFALWGPDDGVPRDPFTLAPSALGEESRFGVDLLLDGVKYVYGFALDDQKITEEWLYHYPRGRRRVLFEREGDDIHFGDSLRGPKNIIEEVTRPNSLFLSAAAHHGLEQLLPIYTSFSRRLTFADPDDYAIRRQRTVALLEDSGTARRMIALLKAADFGIDDVRVNRMPPYFPSDDAGEWMVIQVKNTKPSVVTEILAQSVDSTAKSGWVRAAPELVARPQIALVRNTADGPMPLPLEQESKGTRTWFDFLGLITDALDNGRLVAVDELDASLHPLLAREFVRLFQNPETNRHGAQLVFTTHDTSLLARQGGEETLRRDEVWFTEKNRRGETRLYPLTDFKPRSGLNWERRYLGGSVGAIPFLDEAEFESALDEPRDANE